MKKILALMLALMMALSCTGVLAEATRIDIPVTEPEPETAPEITVNADLGEGVFTTTASLSLDTETVLMLVNMMAPVDEEKLPLITSVLNVLNNASGKLSLFANGAQVDVQLKETPVISFAGAATEDGGTLVVGSDLIPNYLLLVSQEYVQQLVEQYMAQFQAMIGQYAGAAQNIDMQALMMAVMPHVQAFAESLSAHVGEPEMGEYTFEDTAFQVKIPINLTVKEVFALISDLIHGILAEEAVADVVAAVNSAATGLVNVDDILARLDELVADIQETPDEEQPAMEIALYSGADENGYNTNMYFTADLSKDDQTMSVAGGKVNGKVYGHLNVYEQLTVDAYAGAGEEGISASLKVSFSGIYAGVEAQIASLQDVTVALYFMNPMAPVAVVKVVTVPGAESTLALDGEGKTVVSLEDLMNDETREVSSGLMMDVMYYGLSGVMAKAAQIMPEEVTALMSLLSGAK